MRTVGLGLLASLAFAGIAAAADTPAPAAPAIALVRGTIVSVDAKSLTLKTDNGPVTAPLAPTTRYAAVEKRTFDQLKPTDFVGITSSPGKNGHLQAEEIHIIPVAG